MSPSTPHSQPRFLPGSMIANRYRVVAMLGRGGMGEVYRADDLKLGEPVALKFLPERLEGDVSLRERFLGEARLARNVAHPNVCRVYDIGDVDGRLFLSMEYVDGEDLATLLRRIGRLPQEKAVQLARQMCAGLSAAHEMGIVHRDLKPSNIMVDGRGRARITDFGLAALAESITAEEAAAGTPAYMAPEQLVGRDVTVRSDVYALGLVLYELFTGRPAFEANSWAEQLQVKESRTPSAPSQLAPGIDPFVERVILRCLLPDPAQRPGSAAEIALALPGGDPLAAALAAGETPSPEMIAEAGGGTLYSRATAWGWFGAFAALLVAVFIAASRLYLVQLVPIAKPPAVLLDRAREMAAALGWKDAPIDEYHVLVYDAGQTRMLSKRFGRDSVLAHIRAFPGGTFRMNYRRSPRLLFPLNALAWSPAQNDPPMTEPGMLSLNLDGSGRLLSLDAVAARWDTSSADSAPADWAKLFELAGLDAAAFEPATPVFTPTVYADHRAAWVGQLTPDANDRVRIEAASLRGVPVLFRPYPADAPLPPLRAATSSTLETALMWGIWALFLGLLLLAGERARRNLRAGQADARGGMRLALAAALMFIAHVVLVLHFVNDGSWFAGRVLSAISRAALTFLIFGALYLTLEQIIRRTWPEVLVSWMRVLDGRIGDARVGRDVLAGLAAGAGAQLLTIAVAVGWSRLAHAPFPSDIVDNPGIQTDALMGTRAAIDVVLSALLNGLQLGLMAAALLALFTTMVRRRGAAVVLTGVVMLIIQAPSSQHGVGMVILVLVIVGMLAMFVRFGLLSVIAAMLTMLALQNTPLVAPGASWYWPTTLVTLTGLLGLALWSTRSMLVARTRAEAARQWPGAGGASSVLAAATAANVSASAGARVTPDSQLPTQVTPRSSDVSSLPTQVSPRREARD